MGSALLVIIAGAATAYALSRDNKIDQKPPPKSFSQLTGVEVEGEVARRPILGVMIENSPSARPQTGLDSAGIVFEATTEGGITRYLALYQENMPEQVGPVRSLRTHFLEWAMGFDASIAHAGGSAEALQLVKERNAKSMTQFTNPDSYFRVDFRAAPHNLYAKTDNLRALQEKLKHQKSRFSGIPRTGDAPAETAKAAKIEIDFSTSVYKVEFRYDKKNNSYVRYLDGQKHIDKATKKPITVKNLVVLKMSKPINDAIGEGEAWLFKDGKAQKVRWFKKDFDRRLKLLDDNNAEVPLNRGDSWFAALPRGKEVKF